MTNQFSIIWLKKEEHVNLKFTAFKIFSRSQNILIYQYLKSAVCFFKTYNYDIFFQSHILKGNDTKWMSSVK